MLWVPFCYGNIPQTATDHKPTSCLTPWLDTRSNYYLFHISYLNWYLKMRSVGNDGCIDYSIKFPMNRIIVKRAWGVLECT